MLVSGLTVTPQWLCDVFVFEDRNDIETWEDR